MMIQERKGASGGLDMRLSIDHPVLIRLGLEPDAPSIGVHRGPICVGTALTVEGRGYLISAVTIERGRAPCAHVLPDSRDLAELLPPPSIAYHDYFRGSLANGPR